MICEWDASCIKSVLQKCNFSHHAQDAQGAPEIGVAGAGGFTPRYELAQDNSGRDSPSWMSSEVVLGQSLDRWGGGALGPPSSVPKPKDLLLPWSACVVCTV